MIKDPYLRDYSCLYRGIVENNKDPKNLGRCKIRVPSVHGSLNYPIDILPWARPLVLSPVGKNRGSVHLPDIGDIVWVLFEGANKEFPVYLGGTYATGDMSISTDVINFYTEDGTSIKFDRKNNSVVVDVGDNRVTISPKNISIVGNVNIKGSLTVDNMIINRSCNREDR